MLINVSIAIENGIIKLPFLSYHETFFEDLIL